MRNKTRRARGHILPSQTNTAQRKWTNLSTKAARRIVALVAASAAVAGGALSPSARAADPIGTIATVNPEGAFGTNTFTGDAVLWNGSLYASRTAPVVGYTTWSATPGAGTPFTPVSLPTVAVSTVLGSNLISIDKTTGNVYSTNSNGSVLALGAVLGGGAADFSVTAVGGDLWISRLNTLYRYAAVGITLPPPGPAVHTAAPGSTLRSAKGPDGNVWVSVDLPGLGVDEVRSFTVGGGVGAVFPLVANVNPTAIAADANAVWVAEAGAFVRRIVGTTVTQYPLPAGALPKALTTGPDGAVWIAEDGPTPSVAQLTVTGSTFARQGFLIPGSGFGLRGISTGPDGNVWAIGVNTAAKFGTVATTAPAFTAQTPPLVATVGTAYANYTFTASGTPAPTFTVDSGALPAGITLSSAGVLSGTPTAAGTFTFTVKASNGVGTAPVSGSIVLVVSPIVTTTVTTTTLAPATVAPTFPNALPNSGTGVIGQPFTPYTFVATGTPTPTFSVVGTLPPGLTLSPTGVFSGTPTTPGTYTFSVKASNGTTDAISPLITVVIADPTSAPVFTSLTSPTSPVIGSPYTYTFAAAGTPSPTFTSVGTLPPGLALSPTGVLSGTPTTAGIYNFVVKATNGKSPDAQINVTISVLATNGGGSSGGSGGSGGSAGGTGGSGGAGTGTGTGTGTPSGVAPTFGPVRPPSRAIAGTAFAPFQYSANGTPAAISFSATGTLPPGLTLTSNGVLSGTPTVPGTFNFSVRASNGTAPDAELAGSIIVEPRGTKSGFRCTKTKQSTVKINGVKTKVSVCSKQLRITS